MWEVVLITLICAPALVGVVGGWWVRPWWASGAGVALVVLGFLALVVSPIDDDIPRYLWLALAAWLVGAGVVIGLILRGICAGLQGQR